MNIQSSKPTLVAILVLALASLGWVVPTFAFVTAGGGHFGGGGSRARGCSSYQGGYGGYRSVGYRGGYDGYHGGYGWRGGYGGWGLGGLGIGLYFATRPFYYSTYWADGVPYYYADGNYYEWDGGVGQYETVIPPAVVERQTLAQSPKLVAYPKHGQSKAQQAANKAQCLTWAAAQSGFDPTQDAAINAAASDTANKRSQYMRAEAACLNGRGYSVE
jgi:hypothetical protein